MGILSYFPPQNMQIGILSYLSWMSFLHIWGRRWCNLFKFCLGGAVDGCAVSCNVVMPRPRCELCWEHRPYLRRLCPTCGRRVGAGLPPSLLHGSRSWRRRTRILPSFPTSRCAGFWPTFLFDGVQQNDSSSSPERQTDGLVR